MKRTQWLPVALVLSLASLSVACSSADGDPEPGELNDDEIEAWNSAFEEMESGKADTAGCSGVIVPDRNGFNKRIALTFDDGPHPVLTPVILDLLDQYRAKATFLLIGKQAETYPELVRLIAERGHEIGNHSYSHRNLTEMSGLEVERELVMTRQIVRRACGEFITLFRPPGGHYNATVRAATRTTGHSPVFWNENIGNYPGRPADEIVTSMLRKVGNSGIVLLHSGYDETPAVLPGLLREFSARGYRMDTVSALCAHSPYVMAEAHAPGPPGWHLQ